MADSDGIKQALAEAQTAKTFETGLAFVGRIIDKVAHLEAAGLEKLNDGVDALMAGAARLGDATGLSVVGKSAHKAIANGELAAGKALIRDAGQSETAPNAPVPSALPRNVQAPQLELASIKAAAPPSAPKALSVKEKIAEEQKILIAAGYGEILTRHGEGKNGVDGLRGRDTIAAENQYRKDHHLAANTAITGGQPVDGIAKPSATPSAANRSNLNLREI